MSNELKISVIGAGSSYTPELVEGFIESQQELNVRELALMDIDPVKLQIVGGLAQRMALAGSKGMKVTLTQDRRECIAGADFVITQIRVGGMKARIKDEKIPLQFGAIGQETTGPGGFAKALRTIPVLLSIAQDIEMLAPSAFLINFTNPAGLITEALQRYSRVPSIGLCNLPIGTEMRLSKMLGVERSQIRLDWIGLNHLNWVRGVTVDGKDVWPIVLQKEIDTARQNEGDAWGFSDKLIETLGLIPCSYLNYFYQPLRILTKLKALARTRGQEVQEIEAQLMQLYQDSDLSTKPKLLEKRGGAYYSKAAVSLISAIANDKQEIHIINTQNRGAIPDLPHEAVVEVPAQVSANGVCPLPANRLPVQVRGLVQQVKAYEELTVEAAVEGSRKTALQALLNNPLVPSFEAAQEILTALLEAHRNHLPQFFPGW